MREVLERHLRWYNEEDVSDDGPADFSGANLQSIVLVNANLYGACFRGADLRYADLSHADLRKADFTGANMYNADLSWAKIQGATIDYIPLACPDTGSFTAWKKAYYYRASDGSVGDPVVVKLLIPEDAERVSSTNRACRADKALVLEIQTLDGEVLIAEGGASEDGAASMRKKDFIYHVGEMAVPDSFINDQHDNIGPGIHFFINRQDAADYWDFRDVKRLISDIEADYNRRIKYV